MTMTSSKIYANRTVYPIGYGGGGLRGLDDHIISCHSKPSHGTTFKLGDCLSIRHILCEFQQNRSTRGVATVDFLTSGPTDWGINLCFLLLENN